jgi:hypothetical protein
MAGVKGRSGLKPINPKGREWFRRLVDEESLRRKYEANLRAKLDAGDTEAFLKTFEHGYGRPGQTLDVHTKIDLPSGPLKIVIQKAEAIAIGGSDD